MSEPRKFYKNIILVEVLSEDEPLDSNLGLKDIAHEITEGDCSGVVSWKDPILLTPQEAAKALEEQGSDPGFFNLTAEGAEADEDWDPTKEREPAGENEGRH